MSAETMTPAVAKYELEITIEAAKEKVWKAISEETGAWWLPDFHMLGDGSEIHFDCQAGGQLKETAPDGSSLLWFTVQMCVPESSLYLVGHLAADFGGPATTMLCLKLDETDGVTTLKVSDSLYGNIAEATAQSLKEGWALLFGDGLGRHVEAVKD